MAAIPMVVKQIVIDYSRLYIEFFDDQDINSIE